MVPREAPLSQALVKKSKSGRSVDDTIVSEQQLDE
jgi:hypothetical protein